MEVALSETLDQNINDAVKINEVNRSNALHKEMGLNEEVKSSEIIDSLAEVATEEGEVRQHVTIQNLQSSDIGETQALSKNSISDRMEVDTSDNKSLGTTGVSEESGCKSIADASLSEQTDPSNHDTQIDGAMNVVTLHIPKPDTSQSNVVTNDSAKSFADYTTDSLQVSPSTADSKTQGRSKKSPGQKKRKRRGSAWSDEQSEFLMEIWARHTEHKDEEDFNHNAPVYRLIARAMEEKGNQKTWEQCKTRIHTLKRAYKLTKEEIKSGATDITYCRHFDKLEIIMGDNETTTPQMLADILEQKRRQREENVSNIQTPQKRKQTTSTSHLNKQARMQSSESIQSAASQQSETQPSDGPHASQSSSEGSYWHHLHQDHTQYAPQQLTSSLLFVPQLDHSKPTQQSPENQSSSMPQTVVQDPPSYPVTSTSNHTNYLSPSRMTEINNNEILIKSERPGSISPRNYNISTMTTQTWTPPQQVQPKEELEKMRLNLELRKIEMERNKLEMEERQRREERDHQYRMLQLLLFGLGQQNTTHLLSGQGVEPGDVAHAQHSTNLSRALENGLVPGGPHTANEKGLSFNEI